MKGLGYLFYVLCLSLLILALKDLMQTIHFFDRQQLTKVELNHLLPQVYQAKANASL